jgi:hypothetical protein
MTFMLFWQRTLLIIGATAVLAACSTGPLITRTQDLSESADAPYKNILIVALFASFDTRKGLEKAMVTQLSERGTDAVASTSMMKTTTPVTRQTFLAMLEKIDADALLVTQLVNIDSHAVLTDASPEATYNVRPTYYFNVWNVELTEYMEPPFLGVEGTVVLATQIYSVQSREAVWAIESKSDFVQDSGVPRPYTFFLDEARAITTHMSRDGLIVQ